MLKWDIPFKLNKINGFEICIYFIDIKIALFLYTMFLYICKHQRIKKENIWLEY